MDVFNFEIVGWLIIASTFTYLLAFGFTYLLVLTFWRAFRFFGVLNRFKWYRKIFGVRWIRYGSGIWACYDDDIEFWETIISLESYQRPGVSFEYHSNESDVASWSRYAKTSE